VAKAINSDWERLYAAGFGWNQRPARAEFPRIHQAISPPQFVSYQEDIYVV